MALPQYKIRHVPAHKDARGNWSAETWIDFEDRSVKVVSMKRFDESFRTNARCGRFRDGIFVFESGRDWHEEIKSIPIEKVTKRKCNLYHFAAMREAAEIVEKVTLFYELACADGS